MKVKGSDAPAKIGIIASRRFGGAVLRNRAKRKIREVFRRNQDFFPTGVSLVVLPRSGILDSTFSSLENRFVRAVEKLSS
jgi:ribonuclease P protein component